MLRKRKMVVILLVGILCLGTAFCDDPKQEQQQAPDPFENTSVLVEAFVVRVSNEALAKGDVSPIGQSPEGISILKILWCLKDAEKAQVVSGAKAMARHNWESESKNEGTFYVKSEKINMMQTQQGPVETKNVSFSPYVSGVTLKVRPRVQTENVVCFDYSYSESGVNKNEDTTVPPDQFSYDWTGCLAVQSGKPVIAGAIQNEDNTIFLILTATIQNPSDSEK